MSVSYTHLDVYKRQSDWSPIHPALEHELWHVLCRAEIVCKQKFFHVQKNVETLNEQLYSQKTLL